MSDLNAAAKAIEKLAQQFKHMETAAEALKKVGSLEQAEAEVAKRLAVIQAQVADGEAQLHELKDRVMEGNKEADNLMVHAQADAIILRQEAEQSNKNMIAAAADEANSITTAAEHDAVLIVQGASNEVAAIEEKNAFAKAQLEATKERSGKAQAELDDISKALSAAKESLRKFAG